MSERQLSSLLRMNRAGLLRDSTGPRGGCGLAPRRQGLQKIFSDHAFFLSDHALLCTGKRMLLDENALL